MVLKMKLSKVIGWMYKDMVLLERAREEFFAEFDEEVEFMYQVEGLFNEWLIFEFKLPSGRTPVAEYYLTDPDKLPKDQLEELKQMVESERFEFLQILEVNKGKWLKVVGLFSGKEYKLDEQMGSLNADKGCLWGRVAKVNGKWVLVGSDPLFLTITYSDRMKKMMVKSAKKESKKMSARDVLGMLVKKDDGKINKVKMVGNSKREIEKERKMVKKRLI